MYYKLDENQARLIAIDFQYLIGNPLRKGTNLITELVGPRAMTDGTWQVYLSSYLGDKDGWWEIAGHSDMIENLFIYLTENEMQDYFDPNKYGLVQQD